MPNLASAWGQRKSHGNLLRELQNYQTKAIKWADPETGLQKFAFNYGPAPLCLSGGYGSGKTVIGSLKLLYLGFLFPKSRWVIARRKFVQLRDTTMKTFFKWCPPQAYQYGGRRADTEKILRLNNGSEFLWMHMDDPELESVINGLEINGFLLDQAEDIEEEIFERMEGRLGRWDEAEVPEWIMRRHKRKYNEPWPWVNEGSGKPMVPPYAILTCNPDTELHWIYQRFHPESLNHRLERGDKMSYLEQGYKMVIMDSTKNVFLSKHNLKTALTKDESYVRRYVRGEWGIPEGTIHDVSKVSIIEGSQELLDKLRATCTLHRVLDHGDSAPTCCLWYAVDQAGNHFVYREYYFPNGLISEHRENITRLSAGEVYMSNLADPSIGIKSMQKHGGRWSVKDEYGDTIHLPRETAIFWSDADHDEMGLRNRVSEMLKLDPKRINPITGQKGSPRLFFLEQSKEYPLGCRHSIDETRSQKRERLGTHLGKPLFTDERDKSIPDHAYDCIRYMAGARQIGMREMTMRKDRMSFNQIRQRAIRANRRKLRLVAKLVAAQYEELDNGN